MMNDNISAIQTAILVLSFAISSECTQFPQTYHYPTLAVLARGSHLTILLFSLLHRQRRSSHHVSHHLLSCLGFQLHALIVIVSIVVPSSVVLFWVHITLKYSIDLMRVRSAGAPSAVITRRWFVLVHGGAGGSGHEISPDQTTALGQDTNHVAQCYVLRHVGSHTVSGS